MNKKLLALYGLKWSPFSPDVPTEALQMTPRIESFCWRVEQLVGEGGFAMVTGLPGAGRWGSCLASSCILIIAGVAPSSYENGGSRTSMPL